MENLTQEELEYRRYLKKRIRHRKRRRKVLITRAVMAVVLIVIIVLITLLLRFAVRNIVGGMTDKKDKDNKTATETAVPTKKPEIIIPEGYNGVYNQLTMLSDTYPEVNDILINLPQYPINILELFINNQETLSFVVNYPKHKNDTASLGEVTQEEVSSGIPLFNQWDERWGYVKYGNDILAISGCGPTCISMVYSGLFKNTSMSPADMAEYCTNNNYYSQDSGTAWAMMLEGAIDLGLDAKKIGTSETSIREALKAKKPVICSMAPGDFTEQGHFIVLVGIDKKGRIIVNDPNSKARSKKHWSLKRVQKQVKAAWAYSIP